MRKIVVIIVLIVAHLSLFAQKTEIGIVYSPLLISKLTFDKDYIIFNNYTSLTAGDDKFHGYFTGISTGVYFRYKATKRLFYQTELNFFGNNFGKQIPDWASSREKNFTYSSVDIPLMCGVTINPGGNLKYRFYGGINNKIGKFITAFYSSLVVTINDNMNQEYYYTDKIQKRELIQRLRFYYLNAIAGVGISRFANSIDVRMERNIMNINKNMEQYNANFKNMFLYRICISHTFPYKKSKSLKFVGY